MDKKPTAEEVLKLKKLCHSFYGQGAVGYRYNSETHFEGEWDRWIESGILAKWRQHSATWNEKLSLTDILEAHDNNAVEEYKQANQELINALQSIVGIEAWIQDDQMKTKFQNSVYGAIEKFAPPKQ